MGFMDKVKETAAKGGEMAKGAAKAGQDKLEAQKVKKKMDDLLQELGGVVFAQQTGADNPTADASFDAAVERLVNEVKEQEAALEAIGVEADEADDAGGDSGETAATTESGTAPA
jgi:hypothetical protein